MKKMSRSKVLITLCMVVSSLFAASSAFAFASAPSQPPGAPPHGVAMHGDAGGTKLTGTITIDFAPLTASSTAACQISGADRGFATAKLRLRKAGGTLENSGDTKIQGFTASLGLVPLDDPGAIQAKALEVFTPLILQAFFGVTSGMEIYTKDVSDFSVAFSYNSTAAPCTFFLDPADYVSKIDKFTSFADVVLAVN